MVSKISQRVIWARYIKRDHFPGKNFFELVIFGLFSQNQVAIFLEPSPSLLQMLFISCNLNIHGVLHTWNSSQKIYDSDGKY